MRGISFDNIHSYRDLGLIISETVIGEALVKEYSYDLSGGNGKLDMSDYFGEPKYNNRNIKYTFTFFGSRVATYQKYIQICSELNGVYFEKIIDDYNPDYHWKGRCAVGELSFDKNIATVEINLDVYPYMLKNELTISELRFNYLNKNICPHFKMWTSYDNAEYIDPDTCVITNSPNNIYSAYLSVSPNASYTICFSDCGRFYIHEYDSSKATIGQIGLTTGKEKTIITQSDTKFIRIRLFPTGNTIGKTTYKNLMVSSGGEPVPYERYNSGTIIWCDNLRMSAIPTITISAGIKLNCNGITKSFAEGGTYKVPEFKLTKGINYITASNGTTGTTVKVTYQEGVL